MVAILIKTGPKTAANPEGVFDFGRLLKLPLASGGHVPSPAGTNNRTLFKRHCDDGRFFRAYVEELRAAHTGQPIRSTAFPLRITPDFLQQFYSRRRPNVFHNGSKAAACIAYIHSLLPEKYKRFNFLRLPEPTVDRIFLRRDKASTNLLVQATAIVGHDGDVREGAFVRRKFNSTITTRVPVDATLFDYKPSPSIAKAVTSAQLPQLTLTESPHLAAVPFDTLRAKFKSQGITVPQGMVIPVRGDLSSSEFRSCLWQAMNKIRYFSGTPARVVMRSQTGDEFLLPYKAESLADLYTLERGCIAQQKQLHREKTALHKVRLIDAPLTEEPHVYVERYVTPNCSEQSHWDLKVRYKDGRLISFDGRLAEGQNLATLSYMPPEFEGEVTGRRLVIERNPDRRCYNSFDIYDAAQKLGTKFCAVFGSDDVEASLVVDNCGRVFGINGRSLNNSKFVSDLQIECTSFSRIYDWAIAQITHIAATIEQSDWRERRTAMSDPFVFGQMGD